MRDFARKNRNAWRAIWWIPAGFLLAVTGLLFFLGVRAGEPMGVFFALIWGGGALMLIAIGLVPIAASKTTRKGKHHD